MFSKLGAGEIIIIFVVALLVFGPDKLPQLGKSVGKTIGNIKRYMNDTTEEIKEAMSQVEDLGDELRDVGKECEQAVRETASPEPEQLPEENAPPEGAASEADVLEAPIDQPL